MSNENLVHVTIDGCEVCAPAGETILHAALRANIPDSASLRAGQRRRRGRNAACCVVEVKGQDALVPACNTPVAGGMEISTHGERVEASRRMSLSLILAEHGLQFPPTTASAATKTATASGCGRSATPGREASPPTRFPCGQTPSRFESFPGIRSQPVHPLPALRGACNERACNHTLHTAKRGARLTIEAPFSPD